MKVIYPAQCSCGHLFMEKWQFEEVTDKGYIGFCWCGYCMTKLMVKPQKQDKEPKIQQPTGKGKK